jgi:hypothetical protein
VFDLDTVAYFLEVQEIRLGPKYTAKPVDLLSSTHSSKSASKKSLIRVDEDLLKVRPRFTVTLMYLKILFTAVKCTLIDA